MPFETYTRSEIDALMSGVNSRLTALESAPPPVDPPVDPPPVDPPPVDPPPSGTLTVAVGQSAILTEDAAFDSIQLDGTLIFSPAHAVRVTTPHFRQSATGKLVMGGNAHQLRAADLPETSQFVFDGEVAIRGERKAGRVRLAFDALAGATVLNLESDPQGWKVGDRLALPDSRSCGEGQKWAGYSPQHETAKIKSISGRDVALEAPLKFNHKGSRRRNGSVARYPHVFNLSRSVAIGSESSLGHRGSVKFTGRVDMEGVQFSGLGRHTLDDQNNLFPVHFDGCKNPRVVDCVSTCLMNPQPFAWGVVLDNTTGGEFVGCVSYNWFGAGWAVRETAKGNRFTGCNSLGIFGTMPTRHRTGMNGSCFWGLNFDNEFIACVGCSAHGRHQDIVVSAGFDFGVPAHLGTYVPMARFDDNEAYGAMQTGLTLWCMGTDGYGVRSTQESYVRNFCAWHCSDQAFFSYTIQQITFDGFAFHGDLDSYPRPCAFSCGDYWSGNVTLRNIDITGCGVGVQPGSNTPGVFLIDGGRIECEQECVRCDNLCTPGSRAHMPPRITRILGIDFASAIGVAVKADWSTQYGGANWIQLDQIEVELEGKLCRVYRHQQRADFGPVPPRTYYGADTWPPRGRIDSEGAHDADGNGVEGLTNQEAFDRFGQAICGEIAPANAVVIPEVDGLVV